jgi:hypothetical protein
VLPRPGDLDRSEEEPKAVNGFTGAMAAARTVAEYACIAALMWAGANMMFGNRTKATEYVFGASLGFVMILEAERYMQWLKGVFK